MLIETSGCPKQKSIASTLLKVADCLGMGQGGPQGRFAPGQGVQFAALAFVAHLPAMVAIVDAQRLWGGHRWRCCRWCGWRCEFFIDYVKISGYSSSVHFYVQIGGPNGGRRLLTGTVVAEFIIFTRWVGCHEIGLWNEINTPFRSGAVEEISIAIFTWVCSRSLSLRSSKTVSNSRDITRLMPLSERKLTARVERLAVKKLRK